MTDRTPPQEREREARESLDEMALETLKLFAPEIRRVVEERIPHTPECGSHDAAKVALCCEWHACDCGKIQLLDQVGMIENRAEVHPLALDAYAAAVAARVRAELREKVEGMRWHSANCHNRSAAHPCDCATENGAFIDAVLAALAEETTG